MNLRNLFRVAGVIFTLSGLAWLLAPQSMAGPAGITLDAYNVYYVRIIGTYAIASAVMAFLVSGMAPSAARQAVVTYFLVLQVLSLVVNTLAVLGGVVPGGVGWFGVALNLLFVLAFGYFGFIRPEENPTPELQS